MTGPELIAAMRERADQLGLPLRRFAQPLSNNIDTWLRQLEIARRPNAHTIARVQALITGDPVPQAPTWSREPRPPIRHITPATAGEATPQPVDRDPCTWCGTRADLGCKHRRAM